MGTTGNHRWKCANNNEMESDTNGRSYYRLALLCITSPATAINGGNVPTINPITGTVVVPQNRLQAIPLYQICDNLNPTNCCNGNGECGLHH
jgi:hypothetical protein